MQIVNCVWCSDEQLGSWPGDDRTLEMLPPALARRLTLLGRKALQMVYKSISILDNSTIPWIVACRHGDASRRIKLLTDLAKDEELSPTDFSLSVHNAIIAMFSIASGNTHAHSALAGGSESFESGLIEAIALLYDKGGPVGFLFYDYLNERIEDSQIRCCAMIISRSQGTLNLEYRPLTEVCKLNAFNFLEFCTFLNSNEKQYRISAGGGEIIFLHTSSKA